MKRNIVLFIAGVSVFCSCLRNDLDYPLVKGEITAFEVEGQISSDINKVTRTVTVALKEDTEITSLKVNKYEVSEGVTNADVIAPVLDLSKPLSVVLKTYQDYEWNIRAVQEIERYVRCDNQAGDAAIDPDTKEVILYVTDDQALDNIRITAMKLGPVGSKVLTTHGYKNGEKVTEDCRFPMVLDCVVSRTFEVEFRGKTTVWTLNAIRTAVAAEVLSVQSWAHRATVQAQFSGAGVPVVEYRTSDGDWVKAEDVTVDNVKITAELFDLADNESYFVRVSCGDDMSGEYQFLTDEARQLPNSSFDDWWQDGKIWNPFAPGLEGDARIWDTANKAVANWKSSISVPEDKFVAVSGPGKRAVKLESTYAVVKFASATLFNGYYVKLNGIGAELAWGTPFTSKPDALHGYYCYHPTEITYTDAEHASMKGQTDIGQIHILLTDWDEPFHVISTNQTFVDVKNDPHIIAYGNLLINEDNSEYQEFTLKLEYRDVRTPKYIAVVMASSRYGDYFTGGVGSTLYVDELSLLY